MVEEEVAAFGEFHAALLGVGSRHILGFDAGELAFEGEGDDEIFLS